MHMDKIKKAGLKASEPGGSSDMNENDKALDEILDEEINEVSRSVGYYAESNIYPFLKKIEEELKKMLDMEGKNRAIEEVDYAIDYLKSLEHKIITRG